MTKKYRLIKSYPGSPGLGYETNFDEQGEDWGTMGAIVVISDCTDYPEFWEEVKEPLFVTEDGKEIFDEDKYFTVRLDTLEIMKPFENWVSDKKRLKCFSTKELAEQFISENKPIYSKKQIKEALLSAKEEKHTITEEEGFIILSRFNEGKFKQALNL